MRKSVTKHIAGMKDYPLSEKNIKIAFFLTFLRVLDNILQNLILAGSGKCAMAFTCQKHFTLCLALASTSCDPCHTMKTHIV